jgi:hypothetical protein
MMMMMMMMMMMTMTMTTGFVSVIKQHFIVSIQSKGL